jgi:hypothetical protein
MIAYWSTSVVIILGTPTLPLNRSQAIKQMCACEIASSPSFIASTSSATSNTIAAPRSLLCLRAICAIGCYVRLAYRCSLTPLLPSWGTNSTNLPANHWSTTCTRSPTSRTMAQSAKAASSKPSNACTPRAWWLSRSTSRMTPRAML